MQRCLTVPHISSQAIPRRLNKKFDEEKASGKTLEEKCGETVEIKFSTLFTHNILTQGKTDLKRKKLEFFMFFSVKRRISFLRRKERHGLFV